MPIVSEAKLPARETASGSRSTGLPSQGRNLEAIARAEAERDFHTYACAFLGACCGGLAPADSGLLTRPDVLLAREAQPQGAVMGRRDHPLLCGRKRLPTRRCSTQPGLCLSRLVPAVALHSQEAPGWTPSPSPVQVHLKATERTQPALSTPVAASVSLEKESCAEWQPDRLVAALSIPAPLRTLSVGRKPLAVL